MIERSTTFQALLNFLDNEIKETFSGGNILVRSTDTDVITILGLAGRSEGINTNLCRLWIWQPSKVY